MRRKKRKPALLIVVVGAFGCEPDVLTTLDGGGADDGAIDSGFNDAGADAGVEDAGTSPDAGSGPDAGGLDAGADGGIIDAGAVCTPAFPEPSPFECEGDEDACDTVGDVVEATQDVVAVWSRMEGDEVVVDVRFRDFPFSRYRVSAAVYFETRPYRSESDNQFALLLGDGYRPDQLLYGAEFGVGSGPRDPAPYPPEGFGLRPDPSDSDFDPCDAFFLSLEEPILELRFDSNLLVVPPLLVQTKRDFVGGEFDYSFEGSSPTFRPSRGGQPDRSGGLVSFCDIQCLND